MARLELKVIRSTVDPTNLSVRLPEDEHGSAGPFKRAIREAGFFENEDVVMISRSELQALEADARRYELVASPAEEG